MSDCLMNRDNNFSKTCFTSSSSSQRQKENSKGDFVWSLIMDEQKYELTCDPEYLCSNHDFMLVGREKNSAPRVCDTETSSVALQAVITCNSQHCKIYAQCTFLLHAQDPPPTRDTDLPANDQSVLPVVTL